MRAILSAYLHGFTSPDSIEKNYQYKCTGNTQRTSDETAKLAE
jgi:hypothetical protein